MLTQLQMIMLRTPKTVEILIDGWIGRTSLAVVH